MEDGSGHLEVVTAKDGCALEDTVDGEIVVKLSSGQCIVSAVP